MKNSIKIVTRSEDEKCRLEEELRLKEKENEELKAKLKAMEVERHDNEKVNKEIIELKLKIENHDSEIVKLNEKNKRTGNNN